MFAVVQARTKLSKCHSVGGLHGLVKISRSDLKLVSTAHSRGTTPISTQPTSTTCATTVSPSSPVVPRRAGRASGDADGVETAGRVSLVIRTPSVLDPLAVAHAQDHD